jgi:hypothetical protein
MFALLVGMPALVVHPAGGLTPLSRAAAVAPRPSPVIMGDAQVISDLSKAIDGMKYDQVMQWMSLPFGYVAARFLFLTKRMGRDSRGYYEDYEDDFRFESGYGRDDAIGRMRRNEDLPWAPPYPPSLPGSQLTGGYGGSGYGAANRRYERDDYYSSDRRRDESYYPRGPGRRRGPYEYDPGYDQYYGVVEPSRRLPPSRRSPSYERTPSGRRYH